MHEDQTEGASTGAATGPLPMPTGTQPGGQPTTYMPPLPQTPNPQGDSGAPTGLPDHARSHKHHRSPILGPLLLVAAGVVLLLNNLGLLPWNVWETMGKLWPLVLIAVGLDLVLGRRSPVLSGLLLIGVLAAGAAFVYAGNSTVGRTLVAPLNVPLAGATGASITVNADASVLSVAPLSGDSMQLVGGTLAYGEQSGAPAVDVVPGQSTQVTISQQHGGFSFSWFGSNGSKTWDVKLTPKIPLDITVNSGTGNISMDLSSIKLKSVTLNGGVGNTTVTLPTNPNGAAAHIDGGTGNIDVRIPQGVEASIQVNHGLGKVNVDSRFKSVSEATYESPGYASGAAAHKLDLEINAGVGNVAVEPAAAR